jgi:hypothetical protein
MASNQLKSWRNVKALGWREMKLMKKAARISALNQMAEIPRGVMACGSTINENISCESAEALQLAWQETAYHCCSA